MRALVFSAGGLFGAWQVGAWAALMDRFQPDLIVGASVGSLNGYVVACGGTPDDMRRMWLDPQLADPKRLHTNLLEFAHGHQPRIDFALTATDLLRLKPKIFRGAEVTLQHLEASCAVPFFMPQIRIGGRLYTDGGLLNPLPVYAAVELGATQILGLNALPEVPSAMLRPFVLGFRGVFGVNPPLPANVSLASIRSRGGLGTMRDALRWKRENVERWIEQGYEDAKNHFPSDLF